MDDMKITPVGSTISYDEFSKVDVRVGTIERVEEIPKSAKLVKLTVDLGDHKRSILDLS